MVKFKTKADNKKLFCVFFKCIKWAASVLYILSGNPHTRDVIIGWPLM